MGLSLIDAGRRYSLDAWRRRRRGEARPEEAPLWPLWLLRVLAATPYFASGYSKLIDPDWWSGLVTWDRVTRYRRFVERSPLPDGAVELVTSRGFHELFGKVAIFTELFLAVALWFPRTRYLAVWIAVCFHATIEVTARVQVFSWLAMAGLLIWAVPRVRDRRLVLRADRRAGRIVGALVGRLDWLARFRVSWTRDAGAPAVELIDRDGTRHRGGFAARYALSGLPLLAWPMLPLVWWRGCAGEPFWRSPSRASAPRPGDRSRPAA